MELKRNNHAIAIIMMVECNKSENNKLSPLYVKCLKCIFYVLQFSNPSLL